MIAPAFPSRTCLFVWLCLCATSAPAQQLPTGQPTPADEIIRVSTELVQTDVLVLDKRGNFVDNLRPEDFELRVDGHAQSVSFFERVRAGSVNEEAQLAAARGPRAGPTGASNAATRPLDRGRLVFFFIDDLHLSVDSLRRTQTLLARFIEEQLGQNDQIALICATGQLGFLQQLTDDKDVLRAAVKRLAFRERSTRDFDRPLMTPADALSIKRNDQFTLSAFVEAKMRELSIPRAQAEQEVRSRADSIIQLNNLIATQTLSGLQNLLRVSAQLPGRKLVYFISDGFILDNSSPVMSERIEHVTDAALRSGVVIYALDAHGLSTGTLDIADQGMDDLRDPTGQIRARSAGLFDMQESLQIVAEGTGGRALLNTNALSNALKRVLQETSIYYLLAWQPAQEELRGGKFHHIEVRIKQRPELTVSVQRGFFSTAPAEPPRKRDDKHKRTDRAGSNTPDNTQAHADLAAALNSFAPKTALPIALTLNYLVLPKGTVLASTVQVSVEQPPPGQGRQLDLVGLVYDEQGRLASSFERRAALPPKPEAATAEAASAPQLPAKLPRLVLTFQTPTKPGLYQVRVAAREVESGRTGSAAQWLTVPALDGGKFALSSIFLGERPHTADAPEAAPPPEQTQALINPNRRFLRNTFLRFLLYIYNAAPATPTTAPDVALQLQIFRDDQPVVTIPLSKITTTGLTTYTTLFYAADLSLQGLPAGRYILQATAIDRTAKTSATQRVKFMIE